ncbi:MurR/RpiR family transcriptional regulator [Falsihalocynthiibacter arcticus]|uniref:DNA-binding protein n=1 Tax=Falsihalocynthiibacter arcticus TaxID=1579316 RepID=A0A126V6R9_9RHOB|nr:MurR/RpiR family transcriptional regulator [Falsihalocynthiibacter arcticus]AML53566.1 DNA-binding protein [Falsihalocynthiibacter arcticus]
MPPKKNDTFLARIKGNLHEMHPTERRLADFLLSFPGELASYTATELAQLAGVSNATVSRFIKKLGYESYDEARRHVRTDQKTGAAIYLLGSKTKNPDELINAHINQAKDNIDHTFSMTNLKEIDQLAETILAARRVWVIGFRTSFSFANYFQWQILQVIEGVSVIPQQGETLAEHIAGISSEDCVVFLGLQRQVSGNIQLLNLIQSTGARTAFISDGNEERKKGLDWHFHCRTAAPGPLFNHASLIALLHLIAVRVIELAGPTGRKRLAMIESLHETLGDI